MTEQVGQYHEHTCLRSGCSVDFPACTCEAAFGAPCQSYCSECRVLDAKDRAEWAESQVAALAQLHYRYSHGEMSLSDYNAQFDAIVPEPDDALKETP